MIKQMLNVRNPQNCVTAGLEEDLQKQCVCWTLFAAELEKVKISGSVSSRSGCSCRNKQEVMVSSSKLDWDQRTSQSYLDSSGLHFS